MKVSKEQINLRKLQKEEIRQELGIEVIKKLKYVNSTELTAEETWSVFKNTLVETLKEACDTRKTGRWQTKQTVWWNDTIKERRSCTVQGVGENKAGGGLHQIQNCKMT